MLNEKFIVDTNTLRKKMIDSGIRNITDLSEKSGINRNTLANVLNGKTLPSSSVMQALILALDIEAVEAGRIFFTRKLTQNVNSKIED